MNPRGPALGLSLRREHRSDLPHASLHANLRGSATHGIDSLDSSTAGAKQGHMLQWKRRVLSTSRGAADSDAHGSQTSICFHSE